MPTTQVNLRIPDEVMGAIRARDTTNTTAALLTSLERYYYALYEARKGLGQLFTPGECGLILDVLNGTIFNHYLAIMLVDREIHEALDDAGYAEKWEVDAEAFKDKLTMLDYLDKLALVDAVQVWWEATSSDTPPHHKDLFVGHPDNKVATFFTG